MFRPILSIFILFTVCACTNHACTLPSNTLIHFDTQGNISDSAVKGGFYRKIITVHSDTYTVQDFDSSGKARGNAYQTACHGLYSLPIK